MKPDPIVDEIRRFRDSHAAKFGYDLAAICEDLRKRENRENPLLVTRPPRLRLRKTGS